MPKPGRRVGERIRRWRRSRNRSQRWLADEVGVHVNTVARWERNGIDPDHAALPRIAAALGVAVGELGPLRHRDAVVQRGESGGMVHRARPVPVQWAAVAGAMGGRTGCRGAWRVSRGRGYRPRGHSI